MTSPVEGRVTPQAKCRRRMLGAEPAGLAAASKRYPTSDQVAVVEAESDLQHRFANTGVTQAPIEVAL